MQKLAALASLAVAGLTALVPACSSEGSEAGPSPDASADSSLDAALDVPQVDALDAAMDTSDAVTDAITDTGQDASEEADAAPDAGPTWEGHPWYGCTPNDRPSSATVITAFDQVDHYFNPEDRRTVDAEVSFPQGEWERIDMIVDLACPADGDCDNWDRFANVMLVEDPGGPNEEVIELERYMTPYNVGMCMRTDVTRLAPRLTGTKTLRSFIDTWVGPNEAVHGHGWRATVQFVFHPGTPEPGVVPGSLVALWPMESIEVGNPDLPVSETAGTRTIAIPAGTTRAELRVVATGHGQGNRFNCAEFCKLVHEFTVGGTPFSFDPWRDDCDENPLGSTQAGTWKYGRAGWCPGAYTLPQVLDITSAVEPGQEVTIAYDSFSPIHGTYDNTCRPDAGDENNKCSFCAFDSTAGNCDYNGGNHTPPHHRLAVQLLLYP